MISTCIHPHTPTHTHTHTHRGSQSLEEVRSTVNETLSSARGQVEKRKLLAVLRSQQAQALTEEDYELAEQINQRLEETKLTQEHEIAISALKAVSVEWVEVLSRGVGGCRFVWSLLCVCGWVCVWVCVCVGESVACTML